MKAIWNNQIIASAERDQLIYIEGNWYFPPSAVHQEYLKPSSHRTICPWKGEASYYDILVDGQTNEAAAWYYPQPLPDAFEKVKKDFTNYVAFWRGVTVS